MSPDIDPITFDVLALLDSGDTYTPYQLSRRIPGWIDIADMDAIRRHLATIPTACIVEPAVGRFAERWGSRRHHAVGKAPRVKPSTGDPGRWARCRDLQDRAHALLASSPDGLTVADIARAMPSITPDRADTTVRALQRSKRATKSDGRDQAGRREVRWHAVPARSEVTRG